jgi:acyl carrier protein
MNKIDKKKIVSKILIKIKPEIRSVLNKKKVNFLNDGIIDSFDIVRIIAEISKIKKKKINPNKVNRKTFSTVEEIIKLLH